MSAKSHLELTTLNSTTQANPEKCHLTKRKSDSDSYGSTEAVEENEATEVDERNADAAQLTVATAVELIGMGKFQVFIMMICGMFNFADAMEMLLLSVLGPLVQCQWGLAEYKVAFITTVVFIGYLIMAPVWGYLGDHYGRKLVLIPICIWLTVYGVLTAFSPTYTWILILRGMVGAGLAGVGLSYILPSEYSPVRWRARLLVGNGVFWTFGSLFEIAMAASIIPNVPSDSSFKGWQILVIVTSIPMGVVLFLLIWLPESARFLVATGREAEAREILDKAAQLNGKPKLERKLQPEQITRRGHLRDLFCNGPANKVDKTVTATTLGCWFLWFTSGFFYYGMILISALLYNVKADACAKVSLHESDIVKQITDSSHHLCSCKPLPQSVYFSMLISTAGEFIAVIVNLLTLDLLGRKKSMALYLAVQGVATILLIPCALPPEGVTALMFVIRGLSAAYFNVVYIYVCEVYPTRVRSLALGGSSASARVGALITPFLAEVLLHHDYSTALGVYAGVCLMAAGVSLAMPVETKNREQTE